MLDLRPSDRWPICSMIRCEADATGESTLDDVSWYPYCDRCLGQLQALHPVRYWRRG